MLMLKSNSFAQVNFTYTFSANRGHPAVACSNDTVFLNATVSAPFDTFMWQTNPPLFFAGGVTDTFFVLSGGGDLDIILLAIDTDATPHDSVYVIKTIAMLNKPMPYIDVTPSSFVCPGTPVSFKGSFSQPVDSFIWYIAGNTISTQETEVWHIYNSQGFDTVLLIGFNVCGIDSIQVILTIDTDAVPSVFPTVYPNNVCPGVPVQFKAMYGQPHGYVVTWDFGDGSPIITGDIEDFNEVNHVYNTAGNYNAKLVAKWQSGQCTNDSSVSTIVVNVLSNYSPGSANIIVTPGDSVCLGTNFSFYASFTDNFNIRYIKWDMGDGNRYISTYPGVSHTYSSVGTYTVTATAYSYCGDSVQATRTVKVKDSGVPANVSIYASNQTLCPGEDFDLFIYSNMPIDSAVVIFDGNMYALGPNQTSLTLTAPTTYGSHPITVEVLNQCGDWTTYNDVVWVKEPDLSTILTSVYTSANNVCTGEEITFSISVMPSLTIDTVYIDYGDGTIDTIIEPEQGWLYATHAYANEGAYTITLRMVNNCHGIELYSYEHIVVRGLSPNAMINVYPSVVCAGELLYINIYGSYLPLDETQISWDLGDGTVDTGRYVYHTYLNRGTYVVQAFVQSCVGTDTFSKTITVLGAPVYEISASDTAICEGNTINFAANNLNGITATEFLWSFGDGNTDTGQTVSHTYTTPGFYWVTLVALGDTCTYTTYRSIFVTENIPPTAQFIYNYLGNGIVQFFNMSQNATSFQWDFGDGNTSTDMAPTHTYTSNGTYTITLIVSNPCGFSDTFTQTITITDLSTVNVATAQDNQTIIIYPNPIREFIKVQVGDEYASKDLQFIIRDLTGKALISVQTTTSGQLVDVSSLPAGTYLGQVVDTQTGITLWNGKLIKGN